jgi:hypothetical protein
LLHFIIRFSTVPLQKYSSESRLRLSSWKRCTWRSGWVLWSGHRIEDLKRDIILTVIKGPALYLQHQDGDLLYSHRRLGTRALTTVFGTVELIRMGYSRPGVPGIFPLDRALALPARSFSYELQRRLVKAAVQGPFLDSVQTIADLTGVSVSQRSPGADPAGCGTGL